MSQDKEVESVSVVLSAPQLAAVLANQTLSPADMLSNRLWGGLAIAGGVLEMAGAGVLCALPEPLSKAGCIAFGVHGADMAASGIKQVWTGQDTATLINRGAVKLAETMKAPSNMANSIGLSLDIAVPFGFAGMVKAGRVSHITMGRINLLAHEAKAGSRIGGHTIRKHVGQTEAQLRERLRLEPKKRAVSSFKDLHSAESAISDVMQANASRIKVWAKTNPNYSLVLEKRMSKDIGYGIVRKYGELIQMRNVIVVIKYEKYNNMPYYILSSYVNP